MNVKRNGNGKLMMVKRQSKYLMELSCVIKCTDFDKIHLHFYVVYQMNKSWMDEKSIELRESNGLAINVYMYVCPQQE